MEPAPILFIIFNRPDLTAKSFGRIRDAKPKRLFIAADGPRKTKAGEDLLCKKTRETTYLIDWDCEVSRLEREDNLGCKNAVSSAISWFFDQVDEGIILEDDCLADPTFFQYCTELLECYRFDHQVGIISGNNFQAKSFAHSYYFSRYPHIWGWATWKRFWNLYDVHLSDWAGNSSSLQPNIKRRRVRKHLAKQFDLVKSGGIDTWDYQLEYLCVRNGAFCANPCKNLVFNIGFDERATHTRSADSHAMPSSVPMKFPLVHPPNVTADNEADLYTENCIKNVRPNFFAALLKSTRKRYTKLRRLLGFK